MSYVINLEVEMRKGETSDRVVKRFLKKMKKMKLMDEFKEHLYYKKPSDVKREEKKKAKWKQLQKRIEEEEKNKK